MKQYLLILLIAMLASGVVSAQQPVQQRPGATFEVSEYGVDFQADPRLITVMAALEAAGFDPVRAGRTPSVFRAKLRKDLANVDPDLRLRLKNFYERNKLPAPATPADQAARYVSLAWRGSESRRARAFRGSSGRAFGGARFRAVSPRVLSSLRY